MKPFLILLVLIILAGAVFLLGWIQILLPADTYAVVFTKTGGFDDKLISPGTFAWRWEKLIPTNMTLYTFHLTSYRTDITIKGELPSGEAYASIITGKPDFSYAITYSLSVRIVPEKLPELVESHALRPDQLESWYRIEAAKVAQQVSNVIVRLKDPDILYSPENLTVYLQDVLFLQDAYLEMVDLVPTSLDLPDNELYDQAKQTYFKLLEAQENAKIEAIVNRETERERERHALEVLAEYGRLLSEYPVLLEFIDKLKTIKASTGDSMTGSLTLQLPDILNDGD